MIAELFTTILERNVVFGALIGLESMYVLTRVHQNGTAQLWLLLLPLLALASLLSLLFNAVCARLSLGFMVPFLVTVVAAAGATFMAAVHKKFNRRAHEQEASFLFFASIAALLIAVAWWRPAIASIASTLRPAVELWAGYGFGLACFTSLGVRLHPSAVASRLGGIALFYLTMAFIGLTMVGIAGLVIK
jgi:hypothetical protein